MKVIFSRKGVDSAAGKCASPIIGERPVSLPIPSDKSPTTKTYGSLNGILPALASDLTAGRLGRASKCHLDPDIDPEALKDRPEGWRGALGQVGIALSHLRNQSVQAGDLFLFWGVFRQVENSDGTWSYLGDRFSGKRQHCLFGWLMIESVNWIADGGEVLLARYPWLIDHPHVRPGWNHHNAVYVAAESFELDGRLFPGSGVLKRAYRMTLKDCPNLRYWSVPDWLNPNKGGVGMTYHPNSRWGAESNLAVAGRGQEFVADIADRADARKWLADILAEYA